MRIQTFSSSFKPTGFGRWLFSSKFCDLTGYSDKAVRRKIQEGIWTQEREYRKAPDGHTMMNLENYENWVEKRTCQEAEKALA